MAEAVTGDALLTTDCSRGQLGFGDQLWDLWGWILGVVRE